MREKKRKLRATTLSRGRSLSGFELSVGDLSIQERVLRFPLYLASRAVALYSPIGNEVGTEKIRDHALANGKKLFYPRLGQRDRLDLVRIESPSELRPGRYGIPEPLGGEILSAADEKGLIAFVPGLAFDQQGNRLGRGKGCYDRFIRRIRDRAVFVALAYEFQVVEAVPTERWDQKVRYIITERRIIDCKDLNSQSVWVS